MPATKCFAQVRGSVIRATKVDACGVPLRGVGTSAVVVSKRLSSIAWDPVTEDGTNIRERNFGGELSIVDDAKPSLIGYSANIALSGVDPDLVALFTGNPVVKNAAGDTVGFDSVDNVDLDSFGFAIEIWSRIAGSACQGVNGYRNWGYTVFPFLKGGMLGGVTFEDAAVSFSITNAQTQSGNQWGAGPFDVDRGAGPAFSPSPLFTALPANAHYRNILVTLEPPVAACGAATLAAA